MKKTILTVLIASLITSCATTGGVEDSLKQTRDAVATANKKLDATQSIANNNFNYDQDSIYISDTAIQRKDTEMLPQKFQDQVQIDASYYSMRDVATMIERVSGYPVLTDTDQGKNFYLRLTQQTGNLVDLLNAVSSQTDTAWKFSNGKIVISDLQTETFFIKALPGDVQVQNQVNSNNGINSQSAGTQTAGQGGGGTGGGQSQSSGQQNTVQNVQFNLNNSIWTNISDTVKGMLSKSGSMMVSPSTSSITVSDKPSRVSNISDYITKQNDMLKQQVQIDVQVLSVETNATDNYMLNWNMILKGTNASFNMNGQAATAAGSAGTGLIPVFAPTGTTQSFTLTANTGDLAGSQMMMNALSNNTQTSLITSAAATTLNNQPVPIQVIEQQGYVANVSTTQVAQAGTQQSVTTGQLSYGFTLNILPTIEKNGLINIQLSLNLSSLKALNNFSVTGAMVQLPDMIQRNTMQKVTLRSGDCYVTTGFDSDFNTITNSGVGSPNFWLFGGGVSAQKTRQKLVILVTPRIVKM